MRRIRIFFPALGAALLCTGLFLLPGLLGRAGPCRVDVHCPESPGATRYYFELEGQGLSRSIRISYVPGQEGMGSFRDLPPGRYTLRCDGQLLRELELTQTCPEAELWPGPDWPIFPPR